MEQLTQPISPFLEVGLKKCIDSHMYNYIGKLKNDKVEQLKQPIPPFLEVGLKIL